MKFNEDVFLSFKLNIQEFYTLMISGYFSSLPNRKVLSSFLFFFSFSSQLPGYQIPFSSLWLTHSISSYI
jgi:hypothetical protein